MLVFLGQFSLVFAAMVALDFVFAEYTKAVLRRATVAASVHASAIQLFSAVVVIGYVDDRWMIVAAMLGAFLGTWLSVRRA